MAPAWSLPICARGEPRCSTRSVASGSASSSASTGSSRGSSRGRWAERSSSPAPDGVGNCANRAGTGPGPLPLMRRFPADLRSPRREPKVLYVADLAVSAFLVRSTSTLARSGSERRETRERPGQRWCRPVEQTWLAQLLAQQRRSRRSVPSCGARSQPVLTKRRRIHRRRRPAR